MQEKHYFHELPRKEKAKFFAQEHLEGNDKIKRALLALLALVIVLEVALQLIIYPTVINKLKWEPSSPANYATLAGAVFFYVLYMYQPLKLNFLTSPRVKFFSHCFAVVLYSIYTFLSVWQSTHRAVRHNNAEDWALSTISMSYCVLSALLTYFVGPTWYLKLMLVLSGHAGLMVGFSALPALLRAWLYIRFAVSFLYVAAFILLAVWFRYNIFVNSNETEAWNKIYSDVLDKTPSCIAVMNASGEIIYSNSEFQKTVRDNATTFFRNVSRLKVREAPPDYLRKSDLQSTKKPSNYEDSNINDNLLDFAGSPRLPSSFRFDVGKAFSENSLSFSTLEDLLDIYKNFLTENKLETEEQIVFDAKMQRPIQGITFCYEITICPIIEHKKIVLIINNTTHRDLIVSLEHNNDYKDKLLASVSHEFRTPLNGNLGLIQAALDDQTIPQSAKEDLLQPALRSGKLLSHLVDDILDFSKAQENKIIPRYETRSLYDTLKYCRQLLEYSFKIKKINFELVVDPQIPLLFCTDHDRLTQVLLNLLTNALKFTIRGKVVLEATLCGKHPSMVQIKVIDTGIGIPRQKTAKLFKEETLLNIDDSPRRSKGIGLGLKVANRLAKVLAPDFGEAITVSSTGEGGSVFAFLVLDQQVIEEKDDFMESIMENRSFNNGFSAAVRSLLSVLDIPPEFENQEVEDPNFQKFDFKIKKHSQTRARHKSSIALLTPRPKKSYKDLNVLVVDDDSINILVLQSLLKKYDLQVDSAHNGREAVEKISLNPRKYSLVFMDCQMPIMDGFEATKKLCQMMKSQELPIIPIIGCTAFSSKEKLEECIKCGMKEVLNKPVLIDKLCGILTNYLK